MKLPLPVPEETAPSLLPWQQAAEMQDDLLTVCNDLDRLQTLLASACATAPTRWPWRPSATTTARPRSSRPRCAPTR